MKLAGYPEKLENRTCEHRVRVREREREVSPTKSQLTSAFRIAGQLLHELFRRIRLCLITS